jgi:hypothetical protein
LYDKGAEVSVMAQKEFRKIPIEKRPKKKPVTMKISSASKDALNATGIYEMPATVMGKTGKHDIIVIQNINSNAIMGADLIKHLGLVYYAKRKKFAFETDEPQFREAHMEILSAEIILAFTQMPIRMATSTTVGNRPATKLNCNTRLSAAWRGTWMGGTKSRSSNHNGGIKLQSCGHAHSSRN